MKCDGKVRFAKGGDEGIKIILELPTIKKVIIRLFLLGLLMPWLSIIIKIKC